MRILAVVGGRPNFVKIAPILDALTARASDKPLLVHTGQHYDYAMSQAFFEDLAIPAPDFFLGVGSGTHAVQTARVMLAFEPVMTEVQPDLVLVVGDVNSTLAASLVAAKCTTPVAHVEAGLRSFDRSMPEEINRVCTDHLAEYLFTPSADADANLMREGIAPAKIRLVGNVMIDTLRKYEAAARRRAVAAGLGVEPGGYAVLTLHRPGNVDEHVALAQILDAVASVGARLPIVFPIHPRSRKRLIEFGLDRRLDALPAIRVIEPLGYLDFLSLLADARLVLTDSGGIQEETTALDVPCMTLRPNTERPITVTLGTNRVVGTSPARIAEETDRVLRGETRRGVLPPLWDGRAALRIAAVLLGDGNR